MKRIDERWFRFEEPHWSGGDAVVTIRGDKAVQHAKLALSAYRRHPDMTDEELLDEFCVIHWATEVDDADRG